MDLIKRNKSFGILFGVISLLLGIILSLMPVQTEKFLNALVGIGILVMGVLKLGQYLLANKDDEERSATQVVVIVIMIIGGIFVLINPGITMFTIGLVIGIFAFALAIDRFIVAHKRRKLGKPIGTTVVFGIVQLIFAIVMCWNSFEMIIAIVVIAGIYLIANGIMMIASSLLLNDMKE